MSDNHNNNDEHKNEIDEVTGVETTGHEWDGLKELNNPLPRWWVWVFIITCIWSAWYWVIYPAWPTLSGATEGTSGYTQFGELAESQSEIVARQKAYLEKFEEASFEEIMDDPELYAFAIAGGSSAFKDNCATCHGTGGTGGKGYPNLNDDDWLWGGKLSDIHQTLEYGIRVSGSYDTRISQMPAFGKDGLLNEEEIHAVAKHVMYLSGQEERGNIKHFEQGGQIFKQQCASCHGSDGKGMHEFGAPNLTDAIWLYGGDENTVFETIYYSRGGMMPAWGPRLDENTIRQLTVYIHELGGGEAEIPESLLPDKGLREDATPESVQYEKTQNVEPPEEAELPQPHAPVAKDM